MKINSPSRLVALVASLFLSSFAAGAQVDSLLEKINAPNNTVNDREYGVSMTYPAGWSVQHGTRWGKNNDKTTILLMRTRPGGGVSFFYQKFDAESPRSPVIRDWFLSSFQNKEAAKKKDFRDYRNDPSSVTYGSTAGGLPMCSYMATFTKGSNHRTEYYVRVAGETTFVMFVAEGTRAEIDAWRAEIDQMARTVRLP